MQEAILFAANLTFSSVHFLLLRINLLCLSPGGLCLWLVLWLVVVKPGGVGACPRLCVCYPTPMTVSCQSQNLTIVPAGVPYDSQRVFLQNNRITELRADSFGFETQVKMVLLQYLQTFLKVRPFSSLIPLFSPLILCRCFGCTATTSRGSRLEPSVTSGCWRSSTWVITRCSAWKVEPSGVWRSCRACTCIAASWPLSPMISSTSCTACSSSTCRYIQHAHTHLKTHTHMQRYIFDSHARLCTRDTCRNTHFGEMLYRPHHHHRTVAKVQTLLHTHTHTLKD